MRIVEQAVAEDDRERVTVVPDTLDDLWHLQYIIEPGDRVAGDTTRRIQRNDDQLRDTGGEREHLWVELAVEETSFHKFATRLRISGTIEDCSREDQLGAHHTLNVEIHDELTIEKEFKPDQWDRIEDAAATTDDPDVAIVAIEEGDIYVTTVEAYGTEERAHITGTTGKGEYAGQRAELFAEVTKLLSRMEPDAIVFAGPGFTKQDALEYVDEAAPELADRIRTVNTSAGGSRGVHEALKRGAVDEIRTETRVAEEAALIDELTKRIAAGEQVAYGPADVERAAEYGAVETLLIVDERLRRERSTSGDWTVDVDAVVEQVEQQGGDVVVFSHEFDPGEQLSNLGGIAALLRYRLE